MKKLISLLACAAGLVSSGFFFTACNNDDDVTRTTIIKVNPSTVMKNFTYQINAGDLDGVNKGEELRVRLYLFDEDGYLYDSYTQELNNYLTTASFEVDLKENERYTAVAITDVTSSNTGSVGEYWQVSESQNIESMKVTYKGNDGNYGDQEVLGIASSTVRSGQSTTIDVQAAGALICTWIENLHAYSNIADILVWCNRGNGFYDFSSSGKWTANPNLDASPDFANIDISKFNYGVYTYKFLMPQNNLTVTYIFIDDEGDIIHGNYLNNQKFESGNEYLFHMVLDPDDDGSGNYSYGLTNVTGQTRGGASDTVQKVSAESQKASENAVTPRNTWKVKELL